MFSQSLSNQHPENKMCWSFESLRGLTKSPKKHEQLDTLTKRKNLGRRHVVPISNDRCRYLVYSPLGSTTQRYIISIHATLIKMNFHLDDFLQNLLTLTTKWSHLGQHKSHPVSSTSTKTETSPPRRVFAFPNHTTPVTTCWYLASPASTSVGRWHIFHS